MMEQRPIQWLVSGVVALVMIGLLVFVNSGWRTPAPVATPVTAEPWPTSPPTFTPLPPTQAAVAPTLIPLPDLRRIDPSIELAIKFPVTTVTTVSGAQSFFGRDEITLKVTAEVRLAVDLSQAQIRRDGNTLLIRLPRATVSGEPNPIEIEVIGESRRWIGSQITAAQNQALAQARADIKQRVAGDQGLISIASEVAYRRLERWLIDDLGFSRVVIEPLTP
ncbi:MAG TPA: DUF4230 domain-containing protein [Chloroflexus aurantiacus]|jgi:hypothetical protein|uniref:DUF4230 domain-containing protein n=1 Tax=Chloroflexus aurantiacus (strain ATCC 29366 / DSM 635 / J-10-fl) TaxID=324602 RepID=A9WH00_CHLAA|nr:MULTISPECIES: DUF4230 domain-containing protein [Chloroflexus]ABY34095.1 hypothetical protein Caur_0862 [Chloroflexus aurantiacus J-10-fl]RMG49357.1 MAG: DUF4230 domain-containing protein [Chloroflexota bacterium]HBW66220.1 DUF4230 domain-containing protein [Chloroflexus aurantiacus]